MKKLSGFIFLLFSVIVCSQEYKILRDIPYYDNAITTSDAYIAQQCTLDLYLPDGVRDFPTVIYFHGGGITEGKKEIPDELRNKGVAVAGVGYRLSPKVNSPKYVEDAAAAAAWVFQNIKNYGGSDRLIFVSGHSAGGYLAMMIGLDTSYLAKYHIDANRFAGIVPFSGQMITHFTVRNEQKIDALTPTIDSMAPLGHLRADTPPIVLITGDREKELFGRYEENAYMARMLKLKGNTNTVLYELGGFDHGQMAHPAFGILLNEIRDTQNKLKIPPEIIKK